MESVTEYFSRLSDMLAKNEWVVHHEVSFRQIDEKEAYIKGELYIHSGFVLHVAEYIAIEKGGVERPKYRYQLQDKDDKLIARWDNAPHHHTIPTFPFHKHLEYGKIVTSSEMDISRILFELDEIIETIVSI